MNFNNILISGKDESYKFELKNKYENIKSDYFLRTIFDNLQTKKSLEILKYNKRIRIRINLTLNNYKEYSEKYSSIEIELIPFKIYSGRFIKIDKKENESYYRIYFNNNKKEIKRNYLDKENKINNIRIIIDYQIKSFYKLFDGCECIEYIHFKKFYRNNINNISHMFQYCPYKIFKF